MKRIIPLSLSFILLLANAGFAHAASAWQPVSDVDQTHIYYDVAAYNTEELVVVGSTGAILQTDDAGTTWHAITSGVSEPLNGVVVTDSTEAYAVGDSGTILKTENGGGTWTVQTSGNPTDLNDIGMLSHVGTIVGDNGRVLTTGNGGLTWTTQTSNTQNDLYAVAQRSNTEAWAVGENGKLIFSTDTETWNTRSAATTETLYDIIFTSSLIGYTAGTNGTVIRTMDGGSTWTHLANAASVADSRDIRALYASGSTNLIAVGEGLIMRSLDQGATWVEESFTNDGATFYGIIEPSTGGAWAVGGDTNGGFIDTFSEVIVEEPTEEEPTDETAVFGDLIKLVCPTTGTVDVNHPCKAVYYYGSDGKRHAFPNDKTYFTWYTDFNDVVEVDSNFLAAIPLGRNVTYRPGVKMVKFMTVNTVYAVGEYGALRAIASEQVAADLYGTNWNTKIDDISDAFYANYEFDDAINIASEYDLETITVSNITINDVLLAGAQ